MQVMKCFTNFTSCELTIPFQSLIYLYRYLSDITPPLSFLTVTHGTTPPWYTPLVQISFSPHPFAVGKIKGVATILTGMILSTRPLKKRTALQATPTNAWK